MEPIEKKLNKKSCHINVAFVSIANVVENKDDAVTYSNFKGKKLNSIVAVILTIAKIQDILKARVVGVSCSVIVQRLLNFHHIETPYIPLFFTFSAFEEKTEVNIRLR